MRKIGMALIAEKKASIQAEEAEGKGRTDARGGARDLLTLLLKSNMATEIPDNQRLSDEDVLARTCCQSHGENLQLIVMQRFQREKTFRADSTAS